MSKERRNRREVKGIAPAFEPLVAAYMEESDYFREQIKAGAVRLGVHPRILERLVVIETAAVAAAIFLFGEEGALQPVGIIDEMQHQRGKNERRGGGYGKVL